MRNCLYLFIMGILCLVTVHVSAQEVTVKGVISKKVTNERIGQVFVKDLNTKTLILSDDVGWFSIKTRVGDTLLFSKDDYTPQKIMVLNNSDMPVYMQPVIKLDEVHIVGQTKRQEINQILGDYKKQGTYYNGKPPVLSFLSNPVGGLYELLGKTPNRARRFAQNAQAEIEQAEVSRHYNTIFVKQYTGLATDSLARKFMNYYTPSYKDIKAWTDYDLIKHTIRAYEYYKNSTEKEKLERLNSPTFIIQDTTVKLGEGPVQLKKEKQPPL
jgi:hypothetical protein